MLDWSAGYVSDVGYTFGAYGELNPNQLHPAFSSAGLINPKIRNACELGFGQGVSINMHAAAGSADWYGTDFNPSQAGFAKELAQHSGARLFDDSFADFSSRTDLPDFDYIGLHGIWSWISDENRGILVDFIKRKLNVGGVLYISYNSLPGWAAVAPLRHLMARHVELQSPAGTGISERIGTALAFGENLFSANSGYAKANSAVKERFEKLKEQNRNYLAHEYFNRDWDPMYFADLARWLEPAKLNFACSANLLDHVDALNLTNDQQSVLNGIANPEFKQSVRDFMVNQQFRKDYWVRGARSFSVFDQAEALRNLRLVLVAHRADMSLKVPGSLGEASLAEGVYNPILDFMADHKVRTLSEIEQAPECKSLNFAQIIQAAVVLCGAGHFLFAQTQSEISAAKKRSKALNTCLFDKARGSEDVAYLASPVTGGAIRVTRFQQLFLLARAKGHKQPADWAAFSWEILRAQAQKIIKDGSAIEKDEDNLNELSAQAKVFAEKRLPILKALEIA